MTSAIACGQAKHSGGPIQATSAIAAASTSDAFRMYSWLLQPNLSQSSVSVRPGDRQALAKLAMSETAPLRRRIDAYHLTMVCFRRRARWSATQKASTSCAFFWAWLKPDSSRASISNCPCGFRKPAARALLPSSCSVVPCRTSSSDHCRLCSWHGKCCWSAWLAMAVPRGGLAGFLPCLRLPQASAERAGRCALA